MRSASSSSGTTELIEAILTDAAIAPFCNNAGHAAVQSGPIHCHTMIWGAPCLALLLLPGWLAQLSWPS
jgi:hypothetical protein